MIYSIFTWNVEKKIIHISRAILWFHVYSKVGNLRYANSPNRILNLKFETNAQMQRFAFQLPVNPFPVAISSHMDLCSWCFCISVKSWSGLCRVIDWSEICLTGQTYSSPIQRWPHSRWWWWWWWWWWYWWWGWYWLLPYSLWWQKYWWHLHTWWHWC